MASAPKAATIAINTPWAAGNGQFAVNEVGGAFGFLSLSGAMTFEFQTAQTGLLNLVGITENQDRTNLWGVQVFKDPLGANTELFAVDGNNLTPSTDPSGIDGVIGSIASIMKDTTYQILVTYSVLNPPDIGAFQASFFFQQDPNQLNPVPVPAALPLFAGGLGLMGLLGWRRKRKAEAV